MGLSIAQKLEFPFYTLHASNDAAIDDRPTIQAAIDAAASGGTILVADGEYTITRVNPGTIDYCVNINKPLTFHLLQGAKLSLADGQITNGTDECYMVQISSSDVYIQGSGEITMNRAGQTDTTIGTNISSRTIINSNGGTYDNINISGIKIRDAMGDGIRLKGANNTTGVLTDITIEHIKMYNCREGILLHWSNGIKCNHNRLSMDNSTDAQDGFETSECDDSEFIGNYVENAKGSGYDLFFAGERCIASLNTAKGCGSGIAIGNNTGAGGTGKDYIVSYNIISGSTLTFGLAVYLNTGADRVLINGNMIRDTQVQHAIDIAAGSGIKITANLVEDATVGNGVYVRAGVNGTVISDNKFKNLIGGSGIGIRIDADDCDVNINRIENSGSFGIVLNGNSNFVNGNRLTGEIIDDNGTSNRVINNDVAALDITGATTPIHHDNIVAGVWTV